MPLTVEDCACTDSLGRETLTVVRTSEVGAGRRRRVDATLVDGSPDGRPCSGRVLDHVGTHQHLAVDLRPRLDERERSTTDVRVTDRRSGPLVGYRGGFTCTYPEVVGDDVPRSVEPLREEHRR